jgi:LysM repeat protein
MLQFERVVYYKVKKGQTLAEIAAYFSVSERVLAQENNLTEPPKNGQILHIPTACGNSYIVREGDTKELLCGSAENYRQKNGTDSFYIGMKVII